MWLYGILWFNLSNISHVQLLKVSITNTDHVFGALYVTKSCVDATDLVISQHSNYSNTIALLEHSNLTLYGTTVITNNTIGTSMLGIKTDSVIVLIQHFNLTIEDIKISNNFSPLGVVALINGSVDSRFTGIKKNTFEVNNNAVMTGGSLSFENVAVDFDTVLHFVDNSQTDESIESTGCLILRSSTLDLKGDLISIKNQGYVTSLQVIQSHIVINGNLNISDNYNGFQSLSLIQQTTLKIIGQLVVERNYLNQGIPSATARSGGSFGPRERLESRTPS